MFGFRVWSLVSIFFSVISRIVVVVIVQLMVAIPWFVVLSFGLEGLCSGFIGQGLRLKGWRVGFARLLCLGLAQGAKSTVGATVNISQSPEIRNDCPLSCVGNVDCSSQG